MTSFLEGEIPEKTGRTVFTLFEIYAQEDGLKHHWIESAEFIPTMTEAVELFNVELLVMQKLPRASGSNQLGESLTSFKLLMVPFWR